MTIVNSNESATFALPAESSTATIGDIIEMNDAANRNNLTAIPRNRELFYKKRFGFCNYHDFLCIDGLGLGDYQLYSIDMSHFKQNLLMIRALMKS